MKKLMRKKLALMQGIKPYAKEIEYIESSGGQYIDTDLVGKSGYTLETNMCFTRLATGAYQYFAGFAYSGSSDRLYYIRAANTADRLGYTYGSQNTSTASLYTLVENTYYVLRAVMKADDQRMIVDGAQVGSSTYAVLPVSTTKIKNIYMFAINGVNTTLNYCYARMKSAKWYDENDNLVRDFIPVLDYNNVACIYDKVTGRLFYNKGTGDFTPGNVI